MARAKAQKKKKTREQASRDTMAFSFNPMTLVRRFLQGRLFLTLDFFKHYWVYVLAATIMMLMYISNKYVYQTNLEKVKELTDELNNATTDCVDASAKYNSMIVESRMTQLVDSMRIDLTAPDLPPYELTSDQ